MRLLLTILPLLLLAACIAPHSTEKFPAVHGRVLDSVTHEPVAGATLFVSDHPEVAATSDALGHFSFSARYNHHLGYSIGMCSDDWPSGETWPVVLQITHPHYEPLEWFESGHLYSMHDTEDEWALPDILLAPIGSDAALRTGPR